jgi:phosphatidylserine decarboxylase
MGIRVHPEGRPYLIGAGVVGLVIFLVGWIVGASLWYWLILGGLWAVILAFLVNFFRYPRRPLPQDPEGIYAPCDGKVVLIQQTFESRYFGEPMVQISIFMSPLHVHVNWAPAAGLLVERQVHPGHYLVAWHPKASLLNEQTFLAVVGEPAERRYAVRQIAGVLARRISTYPERLQWIEQGQEIGFIRFGSRVDVLLPLTATILVSVGQPVRGRLTCLAKW